MSNRGCGCNESVTRFNADGIKQVSSDNGATWQSDLTDGRVYGNILPPPLWLVLDPTGDHRCEGAHTCQINMKNATDEILAGVPTAVAEIATIIVSIICYATAGTACAIAGIVEGLVGLIVLITVEGLQTALTQTVWDDVGCILFCHIQDDATFTEAGWQAVKSEIAAKYQGDAGAWLYTMVNIVGPAGLTNMARVSVTASADCSDCACGCDEPELGTIGANLQHRPDLSPNLWQVTTEDNMNPDDETNGRWFAEILLPSCCWLESWSVSAGATVTPVGNRLSWDCQDNQGTGDFGVHGCMKKILFRAYSECQFYFEIYECDQHP